MYDRVSKETKLLAAKDIVANYVKGDTGQKMSQDEVCAFLKRVYGTFDELAPDPEGHRVGLA